jgi:hypothetical protein
MHSGGQLLVKSLVALGATKGFDIPGKSYLAVLDAFHDETEKLDFVLCRNEGGAAFMAAAFEKLTGRPGLCFVTEIRKPVTPPFSSPSTLSSMRLPRPKRSGRNRLPQIPAPEHGA